tara:strand:+ start:1421 stop:1891 length:471 start_codon:yes stop_codon:yes gene_type:complete
MTIPEIDTKIAELETCIAKCKQDISSLEKDRHFLKGPRFKAGDFIDFDHSVESWTMGEIKNSWWDGSDWKYNIQSGKHLYSRSQHQLRPRPKHLPYQGPIKPKHKPHSPVLNITITSDVLQTLGMFTEGGSDDTNSESESERDLQQDSGEGREKDE